MNNSPEVIERAKQWLKAGFDKKTKAQVQEWLDEDNRELTECFAKDLEFGTGGTFLNSGLVNSSGTILSAAEESRLTNTGDMVTRNAIATPVTSRLATTSEIQSGLVIKLPWHQNPRRHAVGFRKLDRFANRKHPGG